MTCVAQVRCRRATFRSFSHPRERTRRFTGVKLARLRGDDSLGTQIASLESDREEDFYIRLEAAAYLVAVRNLGAEGLFAPYLASPDQQIQLEAVITLGEAGTGECVRMLSGILDDADRPYFARSAAAWCLSRIGGTEACRRLVRAFGDVDRNLSARRRWRASSASTQTPCRYSSRDCGRWTRRLRPGVPRRYGSTGRCRPLPSARFPLSLPAETRPSGRFGWPATCPGSGSREPWRIFNGQRQNFTTRSRCCGPSSKAG